MNELVLHGIIPAPFLPMTATFQVDWTSLRSYIGWIAAQKPTAIAMNMDASEGPSLERDEQLEIVRVCRETIDGACPLVSGLIAGSTADAVAWGTQLAAAGAQALTLFPPLPAFLGTPVPSEMTYRYHQAVAEGVGLPIIGFQLPIGFGPDFSRETMARVATIPGFLGIKEASFDTTKTIESIEAARATGRRIGVVTGSDSFILEAMIMGCHGALIGFAGTATAELIRMHDAVVKRDLDTAFTIWERLGPLARFCWRAPLRDYRPRMKEVLVMQGLIRHAATRPPQLGIDDAERAELRQLATGAGLIG